MTKHKLRPDLPPLPERIARLPVAANGYPVPWFVAWVDGPNGEEVPEFRAADARKRHDALVRNLCWVCGDVLGQHKAFVLGPMCAVNRVTSEPACHRECAEFSVRACPFLTKPHMVRREAGLPEGTVEAPGFAIDRNPGCSAVWVAKKFSVINLGGGDYLFRVGEPTEVTWWAEGRTATRAEVIASVESGLPILRSKADGPGDLAEFDRLVAAAQQFFPAEVQVGGSAA